MKISIRTFILIGLLLASVALFLFTDAKYAAFLVVLFAVLLGGAALVTGLAGDAVEVDLTTPLQGERGFDAKARLAVTNKGRLPILKCRLNATAENMLNGEKDELNPDVSILPGKTDQMDFALKDDHCGLLKMSVKDAFVTDPLGIFTRKIRFAEGSDTESDMYYLPRVSELIVNLEEMSTYNMESYKYSQEQKGNDPSEMFDIKEYGEGDSFKAIHWKLSSKLDEIMIRDVQTTKPDVFLEEGPVRADQDHVRDVLEAVDLDRNLLCVDDLRPQHHFLDLRPLRVFRVVADGDAQHFELVAVVLLVYAAKVGHLAAAGTAPACPEVYQNVFSLANEVGELHAVNLEVSEHLAFCGLGGSVEGLLHGLDAGFGLELVGKGIDECEHLCIVIDLDIGNADEAKHVVLVGLDDLEEVLVVLLNCIFGDFFTLVVGEFFLGYILTILGHEVVVPVLIIGKTGLDAVLCRGLGRTVFKVYGNLAAVCDEGHLAAGRHCIRDSRNLGGNLDAELAVCYGKCGVDVGSYNLDGLLTLGDRAGNLCSGFCAAGSYKCHCHSGNDKLFHCIQINDCKDKKLSAQKKRCP